ncbi:MAG: CHC2 zinc finger domain-containing protein [bacterium]|nr:CHC2 zinc finger domain-containing protein [bacterium]
MSTVDDIKARIDLAEYLREQGVQLKPAGSSLKACCPFHNEKSPSFMVNRQKQVFYCFGCQAGGSVFDFVMKREGLEFAEALKLLAERAGVQLEERDPRLEGKKTRALSVLDAATAFFQQQLQKSSAGDGARAYVVKRKITPEMVERFAIGYAPDTWDTLSTYLVQRGFTMQEIVEAGLAIPSQRSIPTSTPSRSPSQGEGEKVGRIYDRFRHRLMFPIHDASGRVVGFTGRILEGGATVGKGGDPPAKYVNTPETAIYKKGAVVYGLWHARDAIRHAGYVVLVEGQMDVVASHGTDVAQTVAVSGTALTSDQLRILKRYTSALHVAFDADPAGEGAAERGIDAALDAGLDVRVIRMPIGTDGKPIAKDADECIQRDADAWRRVVAAPIPVLDYYIDRVRARFDLRTPAGQRDAGRVLTAHLAHVADPIERAAWVRRCAEAIGVPDTAILESIQRTRVDRPTPSTADHPSAHAADPIERLANRFLALCVRFPEPLAPSAQMLVPEVFPTDAQRRLYSQLLLRYTRGEPLPPSDGFIERLELFADHEFAELSTEVLAEEGRRSAHELLRSHISGELKEIAQQMRIVERADNGTDRAEGVSELEKKFHALTKELSTLQ